MLHHCRAEEQAFLLVKTLLVVSFEEIKVRDLYSTSTNSRTLVVIARHTRLPLEGLLVLVDVHRVRFEHVQRPPSKRGADAISSASDEPLVPASEIQENLLVERQHSFRVREDLQHAPYDVRFAKRTPSERKRWSRYGCNRSISKKQ